MVPDLEAVQLIRKKTSREPQHVYPVEMLKVLGFCMFKKKYVIDYNKILQYSFLYLKFISELISASEF